MLRSKDGGKISGDEGRVGWDTEWAKQELMNPQTAIHACSSSSSCAVVRIYRAKQTNSKNKRINTHCASGGGCESGCMCVSDCACPHACLCADAGVCASARERHHRLSVFTPFPGCCCCCCCWKWMAVVSVELKVDLCYSTTRWQNAAILQTEPMLGWPRYCNSSSHSTRFAMAPVRSRHGAV